MQIEVGGVSLTLHVPPGAARDAIAARFERREHEFQETLPDSRALTVRVERGLAFIEYRGMLGTIDLERGEIESPASPVLADSLVRAAVAWHLSLRGALFLHSSALRVVGEQGRFARVFFGASGAGKSTLAAAHGDFVTDELAQVEPVPGVTSTWRVRSTPWWRGSGRPEKLGELVWLVRGERPSVRPVRGAELLRALLRETGRYLPVPEFQARIFDLCARLATMGALRIAAAEGSVVEDVRAALTAYGKEAA